MSGPPEQTVPSVLLRFDQRKPHQQTLHRIIYRKLSGTNSYVSDVLNASLRFSVVLQRQPVEIARIADIFITDAANRHGHLAFYSDHEPKRQARVP